MIKAILIDDDPGCIETLKQELLCFEDTINILNSHTNPEKALLDIKKQKPDVLFLDIEMPQMDGLSLAKKAFGYYEEIVFVTAFKKYWQDAFRVHAFNFLLKPIRSDVLALVIHDLLFKKNSLLNRMEQRINELETSRKKGTICFDYIWLIKDGDEEKKDTEILHKVYWGDIILFEIKKEDEVVIYLKGNSKYIKKNTKLTNIEDDISKLEEEIKRNFYRINVHHILNYKYATLFNPKDNIIFLDETKYKIIHKFPLSVTYPNALKAIKTNKLTSRG